MNDILHPSKSEIYTEKNLYTCTTIVNTFCQNFAWPFVKLKFHFSKNNYMY